MLLKFNSKRVKYCLRITKCKKVPSSETSDRESDKLHIWADLFLQIPRSITSSYQSCSVYLALPVHSTRNLHF